MGPKQNNPFLLLEIGCEEIPARFVSLGMRRLAETAERVFTDFRFHFDHLKTYGTPRRLALTAEIAPEQLSTEKEVWGPPAHLSFDSNGDPTKALEVFLKNHNLSVSEVQKREKGKGLYIYATIKEPSMPVVELLPEALTRLILSLTFPKSMRWGSGSVRFVRPIHWILALYDNKKVPFEIEGIRSNNMTRGHRFLSPASFEIKDSKTYMNLLRNNFVVVDPEERRGLIVESSRRLAQSVNATLIEDEELISHVTDLVEYPQPMLCSFPPEYLELPEELLITVMKGHQKYLALKDLEGRLTNHFIIVSNTKVENADTVTKGAQKVIRARFEDARFYFEEDKRTPLSIRLEALKKVVFHDRIGSLYEKTERIKNIACYIAERCCPERLKDLSLSAQLCKADLVTGVVREFPELQGIMGGYYAESEGYSKEVSTAIKEHYLPRFAGDRLPSTEIGLILSIADKIDNLVSFFSIGELPTGTEDPFALRRQCYGVVTMLIEKGYEITLNQILSQALNSQTTGDKTKVLQSLIEFFRQRFEYLMHTEGYEQDIIQSLFVLLPNTPLHNLRQRAEAVRVFKGKDYYQPLITALKRVNNIAPKEEVPAVSTALFDQDQEKALYQAFQEVNSQVSILIESKLFVEAFEALNRLEPFINDFFDKVLVMDRQKEVRLNRLSLVRSIQQLANSILDFSRLS